MRARANRRTTVCRAATVVKQSVHTWVNENLLSPYRQRERMQIHSMTQGAVLAELAATFCFMPAAAAAC